MNGKLTKIMGYAFFISLILLVLLSSADPSQLWVNIARWISIIVMILAGILYSSIIIYCIIENKKIDKYLNQDDYDSLIAYSYKKANRRSLFLEGRVNYYNYLLLLSYLGKDDVDKAKEYFELTKGKEFMFPMISYWKTCFDFSNGNYEDLKKNRDSFVNHKDVFKAPYKYGLLIELLNIFVLFADGSVKEAKEKISKLDTSTITMPSTIRGINIIKDASLQENE